MRYYYRTYDPFDAVEGMINDLFGTLNDGRRFPPVDVYETDGAYVIEMEVAGYEPDKVRMHVDKHVLHVEADEVKGDGRWYTKEIRTPAFHRSFSLPENAGKLGFFAQIKDARFKQQVRPGDVLELEARVTRTRGAFAFLDAEARIDGNDTATDELTLALGSGVGVR